MIIMDFFKDLLFTKQDLIFKNGTAILNPTYNNDDIIGVRIPEIRKIAKIYYDSDLSKVFLNDLPHKYLEENILHLAFLSLYKDYDLMVLELKKILKYLKSWSETDSFSNKIILKNLDNYFIEIQNFINSNDIYTVRFGICQLMKYYLDDNFQVDYVILVGNIPSRNEYYLQMMIAWFFATSFAKHYEETLKVFLNSKLDAFTFNKTISKCCDSYRISEDKKNFLKSIRK